MDLFWERLLGSYEDPGSLHDQLNCFKNDTETTKHLRLVVVGVMVLIICA